MRIGTLTLHAGFNEGAILQAIALQSTISELSDSEVEIVDHRYPRLMEKVYGPANDERKKAIQNLYDHGIQLSPQRFYSESHRDTFRYIEKRYGLIFVGSDEVWKIAFQRRLRGLLRLQTDPYSPAFPNVFWPDSSICSRKVAYAATVGEKTCWTTFGSRIAANIARRLNAFQAIGVRDERTKAFVTWADHSLEKRITWTPDPTFLTDLTRKVPEAEVRDLLAHLGVDFTRPRALVIAGEHPLYRDAIARLRALGMQTVSVSDPNSYTDLDLTKAPIGPLEWAGLSRHFDLCLSERMHGCIFALLNHAPLICLDRRRPTEGFPTKNHVIMSKFDLEDRYVSTSDHDANDRLLSLCENWNNIRYDQVQHNKIISEFRKIGRDFIISSLRGTKV